jgi:hypothetical protein
MWCWVGFRVYLHYIKIYAACETERTKSSQNSCIWQLLAYSNKKTFLVRLTSVDVLLSVEAREREKSKDNVTSLSKYFSSFENDGHYKGVKIER